MTRRYSSEYKNLQPYVIEDVRKVVNAAGVSGGGGGVSGVTDHGALTGLSDDDHPQYLTPVRGDARYIPATRNISAGAGLTGGGDLSADRTLAVGAGLGITVNADDISLTIPGTLTVSSGNNASGNHTHAITSSSNPGANARILATDASGALTLLDLFVTGTLDFGTNTIYEDASYLQVTGSKAVIFNQNIGNANWIIYNSGSAQFHGNLEVTNGGDLTVAGSGSYAGNQVLFADSNGGNVGILCAPDSQFALDIAGPCRAEWFIGPHAIQLKDVLMLCHYDGRMPWQTNYRGELNGHMGQVGSATGGVIFRPGKFYKAVQTAYYGQNLITNPSFELNLDGWGTDFPATTTLARSTGAYIGNYSAKVISTGSSNFYSPTVAVANGTTYMLSFYYVHGSGTATIRVKEYGNNVDVFSETLPVSGSWTRYYKAFTTPASGCTTIRAILSGTSFGNIYMDAVQVEQRGYVTPYIDGTLGGYSAGGTPDGSGHAWSGAAHASTSSRSASQIYYPTANNLGFVGTIMAWVKRDGLHGNNMTVLRASGTTAGHIILRITPAGYPQTYAGTAGVTGPDVVPYDTWTHLAMVYTGSNVYLYVNGRHAAHGASAGFEGMPVNMYVGCFGTADEFNGLIDDLCILDRAMEINPSTYECPEIRAVYDSDAPVFAETSRYGFRPTPQGLIWADDEGLWMRDVDGNPVLGIYGGEAATKSWDAFTLAAGDMVLGHNAANSSAIWWDRSAGTFGFYGNAGGTPQVIIDTDGSIVAGAGALALNSGGIQITAPSSSSTIGSYKFLVTGKTITSGLSAYYNSGTNTYSTGVFSVSSDIGNIVTGMSAQIGGGGGVSIAFALTNSLGTSTTTYALSGGGVATWWVNAGYLGIGTAAAPTRTLQVAGGIFAGGEETGLAGYVQLTNSTQGVSSGTGTVKMNGATSRNSVGWLKLFSGTTAIYVPYWTTVTG